MRRNICEGGKKKVELLDVYDGNGKVTGRKIVRGDKNVKFDKDEHIAVAVIFIENSKGEFLIQKTSSEKGGEFSSTGGHVDSGETPLQAIEREVEEELGVNIDKKEIKPLGFLLFDMPLRFLFYVKKDIDIKDVKLQKEEVDYVKYMSVDEVRNLIKTQKMTKSHALMFEELLKKVNCQNANVKL